jgi:hypothetical protein
VSISHVASYLQYLDRLSYWLILTSLLYQGINFQYACNMHGKKKDFKM